MTKLMVVLPNFANAPKNAVAALVHTVTGIRLPLQTRYTRISDHHHLRKAILPNTARSGLHDVAQWRTEGGGVQTPPRNSEDNGGVLDRISKKNRRLDFLLQFTVFSYGCNLLNKGFF